MDRRNPTSSSGGVRWPTGSSVVHDSGQGGMFAVACVLEPDDGTGAGWWCCTGQGTPRLVLQERLVGVRVWDGTACLEVDADEFAAVAFPNLLIDQVGASATDRYLSSAVRAAVVLGTSGGSWTYGSGPWGYGESSYWAAGLHDLDPDAQAVVRTLHTAYGLPVHIATFIGV
jgi:hypothetical protein